MIWDLNWIDRSQTAAQVHANVCVRSRGRPMSMVVQSERAIPCRVSIAAKDCAVRGAGGSSYLVGTSTKRHCYDGSLRALAHLIR